MMRGHEPISRMIIGTLPDPGHLYASGTYLGYNFRGQTATVNGHDLPLDNLVISSQRDRKGKFVTPQARNTLPTSDTLESYL